MGKLAWETLLSNRRLFKRSRVERVVGKGAFAYGFLIGHEDLIGDLKADILITFPHMSIQEFFGAFFFVVLLIEGREIDSILIHNHDDSIFLKNPLFLHFIFWFLSEKCKTEYFSFCNRDKACETLHSYIYSRIHRQLGSREYPAIDFQRALETKDHINLEHFERILQIFNKIKYLVVRPGDAVEWIFNHILPSCLALMVVGESEDSLNCVLPKLLEANGRNVNILMSQKAYRAGVLTCLLEITLQLDREPVVYLFLTEEENVDISQVLHQEMHQLHVVGICPEKINAIASEEFVPATFLSHLSILGHITISKDVLLTVSKAVRKGKLPRLQSLCFTGADVTGGLKDLFIGETTLLNLTHLDFSACKFYWNIKAFNSASKNGLLPKLTSLAISGDTSSLRPRSENYLEYNWVNLTSLSVKDLTELSFRQLSKAISKSRLTHLIKLRLCVRQDEKCNLRKIEPKKIPLLKHLCVQRCITSKEALKHLSCLLSDWSLQTLDISHSRGIQGNLSVLKSRHFASLENLILHDCELNEQDLISLDRVNEKGRLSRLENLDLSENPHLIESFGAVSSRWRSLKTLRINYTPRNQFSMVKNGFDILRPLLDRGCIPSIQELRISAANSVPKHTGRWEHLKSVQLIDTTFNYPMVHPLVTSIQKGDLPSLQTVCLLPDREIRPTALLDIDSDIFDRLSQKGVDVYTANPELEKFMINAGLT